MLTTIRLAASVGRRTGRRSLAYYVPTLTERRDDELGTGGRNTEAGLKVALFGGSGFLGNYVTAELGA